MGDYEMKKCIDDKIGQMIGFYEFDKLSPEDKKLFEDHLLKCDSCYQDVYEFRSAVKTMKKHRKSYLRVLKEKKPILNRIADFLFPSPMPKYRYALAGAAVVVLSFLFIQIFKTDHRPVMISDAGHDSTHIYSRPMIPHGPDVMELRATGDTLKVIDREDKLSRGEFNELLCKSMKAVIGKDAHSILFTWSSMSGVLKYHIDLIMKEEVLRITPTGGIQEQQFQYRIDHVDLKEFYAWRLYGELASGECIFSEKKLEFKF